MTMSDEDRRFRNKQGYGVLAGEGLDELDRVETEVKREGVVFQLKCPDFGHANGILVAWPALILLANQQLPPGWKKTAAGRAYPNVGCRQCRVLCTMEVTPDEAGRYVKQALAAGIVHPQQVQQVMQPGRR